MKDIIEQIIEIDSLAFENKKKNEEYLKNKRQEYENKLVEYRQSMLENARIESEKIVLQISDVDNNKFSEDKITSINSMIENKYAQIEEDLVKIIFNKLFVENTEYSLGATHTLDTKHTVEN